MFRSYIIFQVLLYSLFALSSEILVQDDQVTSQESKKENLEESEIKFKKALNYFKNNQLNDALNGFREIRQSNTNQASAWIYELKTLKLLKKNDEYQELYQQFNHQFNKH